MSCGSDAAQALTPLAFAAFFSLIFDQVIEIPCFASPTLSAERACDRRLLACFFDFAVPADSKNACPASSELPRKIVGYLEPNMHKDSMPPGISATWSGVGVT